MLDSHPSTDAIRQQLCSPLLPEQPGPEGWTRRSFLRALGMGGTAALLGGGLHELLAGGAVRDAFAGPALGSNEGVLLLLTHYGGNDGLNTVVPYTNNRYFSQRGQLAIPANQVLPLDGVHGLHPNLPYLKSLWDVGNVALVHGVGYPNPDLSHFTSMATWMRGSLTPGVPSNGWIGRWLDTVSPELAEMGAATIDSSVPLHMVGRTRRGLGISPYGDLFGADTEPEQLRMYQALMAMNAPAGRGAWHDMYTASLASHLRMAAQLGPALSGVPDGSELVRKMTIAARVINADVGLRVLDVPHGGYDTHDNQPGRHGDLLAEFDAALQAFFATLEPRFRNRVAIVTLSEFGRTPYANESSGTDHGTANVQMVIGDLVHGGHYGTPPSLAVNDQWERLVFTLDFRSLLGSVMEEWMAADAPTIMEGNGFERLGLFGGAPGATVTAVNQPADADGLRPAQRLRR